MNRRRCVMRFPAASRVRAALLAAVLAVLWAGQGARAGTSILDYGDKGRLDQLHEVSPGKPEEKAKGNLESLPPGTERAAKAARLPAPEKVAPETWYEPGEVIVANPPKDFDVAAASEGFRVLEKFRLAELSFEVWRLRVPSGVTVPEAVARLHSRFPGLLLDANHVYHPSQGPDPAASQARAAIGWSGIDSTCGLGVRIGMVDTPVDTSHPALAGQKIAYRSFIRPQRTPAPADHGTAIAAMLVGKPDPDGLGGLLPGAELLAANIFTFNDAGAEVADVVAMLKALDWLAGERVHAVNLSMAGTDNRILHFAVSQAAAKGMILVAAVGNWGTADKPAFPAAYSESIGITAVDANGDIYQYANRGSYVAFAAPGVEIWTAVPGGGKFQSGTSFAAPYLTSVIATEAANGGTISAERFREMLAKEAVDLGPPGRDDTFGWGLVKRPPLCARNEAAAPRRGSE